jgi:hypothetical protein
MPKGTRKHLLLSGMLLIGMTLTSGCAKAPQPEGTLSVSELLEKPLYDTQVHIHGQVRQLGDLRCPCFELTSGGGTILVWYALYEGDATYGPAASVEGIQNGDQGCCERRTEETRSRSPP